MRTIAQDARVEEGVQLDEKVEHDAGVTAGERAYKESLRTTPPKITDYLVDKIGQRLTALGTGLKDARSLNQWIAGGAIRPSNETRLRLLYRVARAIEMVYDQETARAFLQSTSPYLGDVAPVLAIAADAPEEEVLEAVRYFLEP